MSSIVEYLMNYCNATAPPNHTPCDIFHRDGLTCTRAIKRTERRSISKEDGAKEAKKSKLQVILNDCAPEEFSELSYLQSQISLPSFHHAGFIWTGPTSPFQITSARPVRASIQPYTTENEKFQTTTYHPADCRVLGRSLRSGVRFDRLDESFQHSLCMSS